ncbi:helix-turn-helix transcriptional regulator [Nocardia sp. NPDC019255]|uniref:helix-turn-helix domain-containing protein n=1 Tax=Nocardia sp. NPDC019255 TaxID=3154591 RepID=UPI0033D2BA7B
MRIKWARERAGMSRPVLAGLVGRSAEWIKAVETGRLQTPKLPMLLRIAQALEVKDLAELTGNGDAVSVAVFAGPQHEALSEVRHALTDFRMAGNVRPTSVEHLAIRLDQAWKIRHTSPDHRTQLGALLPGLIRDAQQAARIPGPDRRKARRVLAAVYQLADFYVAYQPAPELVWLVADRAMNEGYEADDPYTVACSSWAMVQALRDSGRWEEAIALIQDALDQLDPYLERDATPDDWRGIAGALEAEAAHVHARRGRHGEAWQHWETAEEIAHILGPGYRHTQTSFSIPVMQAHACTLGVELRRSAEALRAARELDPEAIASIPRRSRHYIEVARAYSQHREPAAAFAMLEKSEQTAPETIQYNGFAREMIRDLVKHPPTGMSRDVRELSRRVGVPV